MRLSNLVFCLSMDKILKYVVIHSEESTITTFELFFEGHSADSVIYNLWELQINEFLISYYISPALLL